MATRRSIQGLLALLHEQRRRVDRRATLERNSPEWRAATAGLDELNREIMYQAEHDDGRIDGVGSGMELLLDSRPASDLAFRRSVVGCVRRAVTMANRDRLARGTTQRLESAADRVESLRQVIAFAQVSLRRDFPLARLLDASTGRDMLAGLAVVRLRADREGRVA